MNSIAEHISEENFRNLTDEEVEQLIKQGCSATDWKLLRVNNEFDIQKINNVFFSGEVIIGKNVTLLNIPEGIEGCTVKDGACIINVASIKFEPEAPLGNGTNVAVLDETGSRPVKIFPGISSQIATLMAREPRWAKKIYENDFYQFLESRQKPPQIGENAVVRNCGPILNVFIDNDVKVEGASYLENGSVINNATEGKCLAYIGNGVEAHNFIVEDGILNSKALIFNCYIGQGAEISKGFTAHDSLFFANCSLENGEASAVLGCPYSVSMHKGTLLIGLQTSFMNAGSASNQSNHMYKLGPVHWGVLERGVKTASGSYLMLGAKIGAFSLLMGSHKTHPDSSLFPFSYLFGDERGATVVVPGVMLRSCGLLRDEMKWPTRDRRAKRKLPYFDNIIFNVLNPATIDNMLSAISTIEELLTKPTDDDLYIRYKGMKFTRAALERAKNLYQLAVFKYLNEKLGENKIPPSDGKDAETWVDMGTQIMPRPYLDKALQTSAIIDAQEIFNEAFEKYDLLEQEWIARRFGEWWREREDYIPLKAKEFDQMIEEDRQEYLTNLEMENKMLSL